MQRTPPTTSKCNIINPINPQQQEQQQQQQQQQQLQQQQLLEQNLQQQQTIDPLSYQQQQQDNQPLNNTINNKVINPHEQIKYRETITRFKPKPRTTNTKKTKSST